MVKVGIVGGTGYTGVELLRLLVGHRQVEVVSVTSRAQAGRPIAEHFPSLRHHLSLAFCDPTTAQLEACDVVFFATPNGTAMKTVPQLLRADVRVIDLAADFRLRDATEWSEWYGMVHACPELLGEAAYGLPEVYREQIRDARLVANPGCYPTAVELGFLPLLEADCVQEDSLIADVKSGVSGAGRKEALGTQFSEASDSLRAYGVSGHRHLPEIQQLLRFVARGDESALRLTFVPHLTPMIRGIHATLYARLKPHAEKDIQSLFEQRYEAEAFVDVMPPGSQPDTRSVRGSNTLRLACHRPGDRDQVVVLAVEDNLVKGAAGQAVQNMNIMFGLDESTGLDLVSLFP